MTHPVTKLSDLVPSNYLTAAEFEEEATVTIKSWDIELVGPEEEQCGVLYFEELPRGLVLNKTKRKALQEVYGDDLEPLVGKKVTLFKSETMFKGKLVPSIGMRIPKAQQ